MATKMVTSSDANRDLLPKQIGCTNGIFQLFGRRLFFAGRSAGNHPQKRLLPVGAQQLLEPHNATKAVIEKDLELKKGRTRECLESSQASSYSSSSRSSSLEYTAVKERKHSLNRGLQSPDIRDVVKDSMYREARGVPIKSFAGDERVTVMKHIDSPRLLQRSRGTKDVRMVLPRFSYDGRESRDTLKTNMKLKELPRFSLDSKASSMKHSALDSRLNSLGCDLHMKNENSCQVLPVKKESGSHSRSSSIVTKLMGLEDLSDSNTMDESSITKIKPSPCPRVVFLSKSPTTAERSQAKQGFSPQSLLRKNPTSQSPRERKTISVRKTTTCSKLPLEPAPWKQQDYGQQSQKRARQSGKAPDGSYPSSSVYGAIEKRLTELEFKRSGKDLRALKQILEAMQKTREKLEKQRRESDELTLQESTFEDSCSNQNSSSLMLLNRKTYEQPVLAIKRTFRPKQLSSSAGITMSTKVTGKVKVSRSSQLPRALDSKYDRENAAQRERANYRTPMKNNMKDPNQHFPSIDKKITWRKLESEHSAPQSIKVENCTTSGRGCRMVSPRIQHIVLKTERESHPNSSTSESGRDRKQLSKKVREKCPENRKHRAKSMDLQSSNDQLSNLSSETRYSSYPGDTASTKSESNNSVASHVDTDAISLVNFFSLNSREKQDYVTKPTQHMPAVELAVITVEQPSPVSVLDTPFYSEGSPSPVKKKSTAFRDDSPSPDEAEWNLQTLNHLAACTKSDSSSKNNQKLENPLDLIHEPRWLKTKPKEAAANSNEPAHQSINPGNRYINKMVQALGLLQDTSTIQKGNQYHLLSWGDFSNSNMFHALQEEDCPIEDADEELVENNDQMKLDQRIQGIIVADVANEILVRKINSGRVFTMGRRRMSIQGLIKEVHMEMEHLCRMSSCSVDDEDDWSIRALTVDMKYQSDDWADYSGEVPALVLDIERLIFKDLINEVIICEVSGLCRQLFTM